MEIKKSEKVYLLQKGNVGETPVVFGVYTDLASLKEALIMLAAPVREKLQRVPKYFSCDDEAWGGDAHENCDKNCASCEYFVSPEKYEKEVDQAIHTLHFPYENISVSVMSANEQPGEVLFHDGWEETKEVFPAESVTYYLFPVKESSLSKGKVHYVNELFGEEVFDFFSGALSELEQERKNKK